MPFTRSLQNEQSEAVVLCLSLKKNKSNILDPQVAVQSKNKQKILKHQQKIYSWKEWMFKKTIVILTKIFEFFW